MQKMSWVWFLILLTGGCSFNVKTPVVADYQKLNTVQLTSTRNDIELMLGTPQGSGLHIAYDNSYPLSFYYGFAGVFTLSTAKCDSGTAFMSYDGDRPVHILYFTSKASGPEIILNKDLPIKKLVGQLVLGQTNVQAVYDALGPPDYAGKRIDKRTGAVHNVAFYDASQPQNDGAINEKWILIGYDDHQITQDLIWVSSRQDDITEFGTIEPSQLKQLSRMTVAGFLPVLEPQALSTGTRIDPTQVDALIRTKPRHIKQIRDILGNPSALGIKSFKGDPPMLLSNWSYSNIEMKGTEHSFVPTGASEEQRRELEQAPSYMVMDISQSRLMVGHDQEGIIKEIIWLKPFMP